MSSLDGHKSLDSDVRTRSNLSHAEAPVLAKLAAGITKRRERISTLVSAGLTIEPKMECEELPHALAAQLEALAYLS